MKLSLPVLLLCLGIAAVLPAQTTVTLEASQDNTLFESATGTVSSGSAPGFFVGINGLGQIRRGILAFNVAAAVPVGATVTNATLALYLEMGSPTSLDVAVHRAQAAWGEGSSTAGMGGGGAGGAAAAGDATWLHTFFPGSFWTTPGGDFAPVASATTPVAAPAQYLWNGASLTADVQSWVDAPASNFGWILISPEMVNGLAKRFASREGPVAPLRPMLTVTWVTPTVTNLGFGCGGLSLAANGLPTLGNASFALNLSGANPGSAAAAFLALGVSPSPLLIDGVGPCFYDLDVSTTLAFIDAGLSPLGPTPTDAAGQATLGFPIPPAPALAGFALEVQALAIGSNLASSNALRLAIAP